MNIEMAIVANAIGLVPDTGDELPPGTLEEVARLMQKREDGGPRRYWRVEVTLGAEPSGAVLWSPPSPPADQKTCSQDG